SASRSRRRGASRIRTRASTWLWPILLVISATVTCAQRRCAAADEDSRALLLRTLRDGDSVPLVGTQVTEVVGPAGGSRQTVQSLRRKPGHLRLDYVSPPGVRG